MAIIKMGFVSHDWKEQMDIKEVNSIMKSINETTKITQIITDSDEYTYVVHNSSVELSNVLTKAELIKLWNELFPLLRYGDADIYEDDILQYYNNGIIIVSVDVLKTWLN